MEFIEKNARITATRLGFQRDGIFLGFSINVELDNGNRSFGGWTFDEPVNDEAGRFLRREVTGPELGMSIEKILNALEIDYWEQLSGKICRIRISGVNEYSGNIFAIGNAIKDKWFDIRDIGFQV